MDKSIYVSINIFFYSSINLLKICVPKKQDLSRINRMEKVVVLRRFFVLSKLLIKISLLEFLDYVEPTGIYIYYIKKKYSSNINVILNQLSFLSLSLYILPLFFKSGIIYNSRDKTKQISRTNVARLVSKTFSFSFLFFSFLFFSFLFSE